jgi:hypothetical protein
MEVNGQLHLPAALPPEKEPLVPHWIGGWVGPRAVLDAVVKRKIPSPRKELNPRTPERPVRSQALYRLRYRGSPLRTEVLYKSEYAYSKRNAGRQCVVVIMDCRTTRSPANTG